VFVEDDIAGLKRQRAAIRHGVAGVEAEIDDRSGELGRIDKGGPGAVFQSRFDLDLRAERRSHHLRRFR
jgi:hypothetical protein